MLVPIMLSVAVVHGWSIPHADTLRYASVLRTAAATSSHDVWVGGKDHANEAAEAGRAVIEHWDGKRWNVTHLRAESVRGLSAVGPKDVWASAFETYEGGGVLYHYDGARWTRVTDELPDANGYDVAAVPGAVFVVAQDSADVFIRGASGWEQTSLGEDVHLTAVRARNANDAWAIGGTGDYQKERPFASHWDGRAWSSTPLPINAGHLHGIVSVSPTNAWAIGNGLRPYKGRYEPYGKPFVLHWNGATWKRVSTPAGRGDLRGITATASGRLLIGGYDPAHQNRAFFLRYDKKSWRAFTVAAPRGAKYAEINAVTRAGRDFWAVGAFDHFRDRIVPRELVLRYHP